jgi:hypothetical protein
MFSMTDDVHPSKLTMDLSMEPDIHTTNAMCSTGRPRRGTEATRLEAMMAAATHAFLRDGYDAVSIGS